jgi:Divergent InlB B-repeat domain
MNTRCAMPRKKDLMVIALLIVSIASLSPSVVAGSTDGYVITATANVNGSISPSGMVSVLAGGSQALTITPEPGYRILSVIVDGANAGAVNSYKFTNIQADHSIAAYFKAITYTLTATAEANGAISTPGVNTVNLGSSMTFTITPSAGYHVADVLVDGASAGAVTSYAFTNVAASHTITAAFAENMWFMINASAGANGSISPSGRGAVLGGTNQKYAITPASGYRVADLVVDGEFKGKLASYTFYSVQAAHTISVSFELDVYTINVSTAMGGSVTISGSSITTTTVNGGKSSTITVNPGANVTLNITPDAGRSVRSVIDNGANKRAVTTYTLPNIKANHTINAYFK